MSIIPKISESMQEVLITKAEIFAKQTGFSQRKSKMSGSIFSQTLVFGWWSNPVSTLEELSQTALNLGVEISGQGIDQRFGPQSAQFLRKLLENAATKLICTDKASEKILNKFSSVNILDSSIVLLPDELKSIWQGSGGSTSTGSAVKIEVSLDLSNGELHGPILENGRGPDTGSVINKDIPPPGGLRIADLGYYSIGKLKEIDNQSGYFLSRWHVQSLIYSTDLKKIDLVELLKGKTSLEMDVLLSSQKLPVRLLAIKVPPKEKEKRLTRLKQKAHKACRPVNPLKEALADYNIYVTNVPQTLLTFKEALILLKARWQIELLFKLWKSKGKIDEWRSANPWRILTEFYAKLIAMLFQHWMLLISCWAYSDRSLTKIAKNIQKNISLLIFNFNQKSPEHFEQNLIRVSKVLKCSRVNKRKNNPALHQLLNQPQSLLYALD